MAVPGKGVVSAQAPVDLTHRNQRLIQAELQKGTGQMREGENLNPVRTLHMRYDAWRRGQPADHR